MILAVQWERASRTPEERTRISLTFRNAILDYFDGVENAKKSYDFYCSNTNKPFQDWPFAYHHARERVRHLLSPWEKGHSTFKPTFQ